MLWDAQKGLWYIDCGGQRRYLGRLAITPATRRKYAIARAAVNVVPEAQWTEQDFRVYAPPVKDQDGEGACVAFSGTTLHQTSRAMQGMTAASLSCGHLYGQINGGQDGGAVVEDALKALEQTGQCTTLEVGDLAWQPRKWPASAGTVAARFKVEIGGEVTTFEEICSLLEAGKLVAIGIDCGRNFNPDGAGVLPDQAGAGGGHGLPVLGKKKIGGVWHLIIRNSWGTGWGDRGDCYMPRSYIDRAGGGHYQITACRDDPQDATNAPAAK